MRKAFLHVLGLAIAMEGLKFNDYDSYEPKGNLHTPDVTPKRYTRTKGYRNYQFDANGNYNTNSVLINEIVFTCTAKSESDAVRKFNEFQSK